MINVGFRGSRSVTGPATWSQQGIWRTMLKSTACGESMNSYFVLPLPTDITYSRIANAVSDTVSAHEALRTTYPLDRGGALCQSVTRSGDAKIELVEERDLLFGHKHLLAQTANLPFDHQYELPIRFTLLANGGEPTRLMVVLSPLSADWAAEEILRREIAARLLGNVSQHSTTRTLSPVDRAFEELTPTMQRKSLLAVSRWTRLVQDHEPTNFPPSESQKGVRWEMAKLQSRSMAQSAIEIAKKYQVSVPAVYHAASAVMMSTLSRKPFSVMHNMCSNRFTTAEQAYVGRLTQASAAAVPVADLTFGEVVSKAAIAGIRSYAMAQYSTYDVDRIVEAEEFDCFHNSIFKNGQYVDYEYRAKLGSATGGSEVVVLNPPKFGTHRFALEVSHIRGLARMSLQNDSSIASGMCTDRILRAMESLILQSADNPSQSPATVVAINALDAFA
ncbi:condensation domain-containing protein [Mycolicibacterium neoaurum]|uniref:condensation domain-containing protein n=1 Tax=Mycolicibacterium neoaurum TaxID=1795 RepID=UPI0024098EDF|nr:condensation domain-containing protein [Mycolicibacterium neoaurum]